MLRPLLASAVFSLAFGCGVHFEERDFRALYRPGGEFWQAPLPTATRDEALDRGASSASGLLFDAASALLSESWSNGAVVFPVTEDVRQGSLPEDGAGVPRFASVFMLDLETDGRIPIVVDVEALPDGGRAIVVRPDGVAPAANRRYAAILTDDVLDADRGRLGRSEAFNSAFELEDDAEPALRTMLREVRAALVRSGFELPRVACAAVFETEVTVAP